MDLRCRHATRLQNVSHGIEQARRSAQVAFMCDQLVGTGQNRRQIRDGIAGGMGFQSETGIGSGQTFQFVKSGNALLGFVAGRPERA